MNFFKKIICNPLTILLSLYWLPLLGISLFLVRYMIYDSRANKRLAIGVLMLAFVIRLPQIIHIVTNWLNISDVSGLESINSHDIYSTFIRYSNLLLGLGIFFFLAQLLFQQAFSKMKSYFIAQEQKRLAIYRENDLTMKLNREKAKNTQVVYCPNCGAHNIIVGKIGTCSYCRQKIVAQK